MVLKLGPDPALRHPHSFFTYIGHGTSIFFLVKFYKKVEKHAKLRGIKTEVQHGQRIPTSVEAAGVEVQVFFSEDKTINRMEADEDAVPFIQLSERRNKLVHTKSCSGAGSAHAIPRRYPTRRDGR